MAQGVRQQVREHLADPSRVDGERRDPRVYLDANLDSVAARGSGKVRRDITQQ